MDAKTETKRETRHGKYAPETMYAIKYILLKNPEATSTQIAKILGLSPSTVMTVKWLLRKKGELPPSPRQNNKRSQTQNKPPEKNIEKRRSRDALDELLDELLGSPKKQSKKQKSENIEKEKYKSSS